MPRKVRRKRRTNKYNEWHLHQLATGHCYVAGVAFDDDMEAMKEAWEQLQEPFMEVWKVEYAGSRPYAWWMFEAPESRLRIDGKQHPFDNPERKDKRLYYGKPRIMIGKDDFMAEYEGELKYLLRLGLIEADEVKRFKEKPQHSKGPQRAGSKLLATIQATGVVT
ncbi:MAG: hypothetical protein CMJ38_00550 [Phycisphaerae bacterium]|nr:hypothetical protein [Phycisphaerae bacterium]